MPISYTQDGGYYEISIANDPAGPYTVNGLTSDKAADSFWLGDVQANAQQYLRLRSYTPPHGDQVNALWSEYTPATAVLQVDPGSAALLNYPDDSGGATQLAFPAGTVTQTTLLAFTPIENVRRPVDQAFGGRAFHLQATHLGSGRSSLNWQQPALITLDYTELQIHSLIESTLNLYAWNGVVWQPGACGNLVSSRIKTGYHCRSASLDNMLYLQKPNTFFCP